MNYPEGSMRGSGIYSVDVTITVTCPECENEWDDDFQTDDWGNVDQDVTCPTCNITVNVTQEHRGNDYDD